MNNVRFGATAWVVLLLLSSFSMHAQTPQAAALTARQQSIVSISAFTARGALPHLHNALGKGLNTGLTEPLLRQLLALEEKNIGKKEADVGCEILDKVLTASKKK
jgi:hypothetical protein